MRKYVFIFIAVVSFQNLIAQSEGEKRAIDAIDSMKKILPSLAESDQVDCLNAMAFQYAHISSDQKAAEASMEEIALKANSLAKKIGYSKGLGYSLLRLSQVEAWKNNLYWESNGKNNPVLMRNQEQYIEQAISIGEKINNEELLGNAYQRLAEVKNDEEDFRTAVQAIAKTIEYKKNKSTKGELADLYYAQAWLNFRLFDLPVSEEASKKAVALYNEIGDKESEIFVLTELCKVYEIPGDFEKGIETCKKSISLAEQLPKDKLTQASGQAFFWMCRWYKIAGDYETALDIIRRGRNYYPNPIDSVSNAYWTATIGDVHRLMGNYDSASYYLEPFKITTNVPNNFGKVALGYLYLDQKKYDNALEVITPLVLELKKIKRRIVPLPNVLMISARAFMGKKNYLAALQNAREALFDVKQMKANLMMIDDYKLLSDIFSGLGKNDSAYFYLNLYTGLKDSLLNRQFYFRLNAYKKEFEEQKKISQINLLNKENQIKDQKLRQQAIVRNGLIAGFILLLLLAVFIFRSLTLKRKKERAELERKATELEMQALRAQMNPHFIFNCLSSINKFILKNDSDAASDYLTRFSRLIRQSLTNSQLSLIPLSDEVEMLRLYLDMERLRFSDSFDYNIIYENTIEPETIYIPPMLLQPFCENAIWHGLMHKEGQGKLDVAMSVQNGELQCIIADNGIGREKAAELKTKSGTKQKSFGLKITTERLALFNDEKAINSFYRTEDIQDEEGNAAGTKVILNIKFKNTAHLAVKKTS